MSFIRTLGRALPIGVAVAGRKRNALFKTVDPLFRSSAKNDTIATPWGELSLDSSHPPERLLSYFFYNVLRYYQRSELGRYIERIAAPNATFVDIGANLGMYALVARQHDFKTVVVEPEPSHNAFLKRNEGIFGTVLPIALSDRAGALPLYYEAENPGATSLFASPKCLRSEGSVPVSTFSEVAMKGDLGDVSNIRLVKIDVEGFEAEVVEGMREFISGGRRPDIWCEVRGDRSGRNGGSYRRVMETLRAFGYVARELRDGRDQTLDNHQLSERSVFDLLFTAR